MRNFNGLSNSVEEQIYEFDRRYLGRDDEPIVGRTAKEFADEGIRHPERYTFLSDWFVNEKAVTNLNEGLILDLGSGPGYLTREIAKKVSKDIDIVGVDISRDMLEISRKHIDSFDNVSFAYCDARLVKDFAYKEIDAIISRRMIHRVDDLENFLGKIVGSLKPEGGLMLNYGFRRPTNFQELKAFLDEAKLRKSHQSLFDAFVKAVLNAPTLEEYRRAGNKIARKLRLKRFEIKVFPFDVGMIFVR